jgi:hypothetical protein
VVEGCCEANAIGKVDTVEHDLAANRALPIAYGAFRIDTAISLSNVVLVTSIDECMSA